MINEELIYDFKDFLKRESRFIALLKYEKGLPSYEISKIVGVSIAEVDKAIEEVTITIRQIMTSSIVCWEQK